MIKIVIKFKSNKKHLFLLLLCCDCYNLIKDRYVSLKYNQNQLSLFINYIYEKKTKINNWRDNINWFIEATVMHPTEQEEIIIVLIEI